MPRTYKNRTARRRKSTTRGGSQRAYSSRERFLRGMLELDRQNYEKWESKADALEQDVEVLERKRDEQRANNAPARKQIQADLTKKREELRVAKRFCELTREAVRRDLEELAALNTTA